MNKITTRKCHERGHPELELAYDSEKLLALDAERFAEVLERMVHAGSRFEIGQSLQIGWSLAWFTQGSSPGVLGFEEPDMLLDSCLICSRVEISPVFFMDRSEPDGADSGWFIGCCDEEHDHNQVSELERVSLYEAVVRRCAGALPYSEERRWER